MASPFSLCLYFHFFLPPFLVVSRLFWWLGSIWDVKKLWQFGLGLKFGAFEWVSCGSGKKKEYKIKLKMLVKEGSEENFKRVFRSWCKMCDLLCSSDTLTATLSSFFLLPKSNNTLLIKKSILTDTEQHPLTKSLFLFRWVVS